MAVILDHMKLTETKLTTAVVSNIQYQNIYENMLAPIPPGVATNNNSTTMDVA